MTLDHQRIEKRLNKKIGDFSAKLMSNAKWLKLFKVLSIHHEVIKKCYLISIYDNIPWLLDIPDINMFETTFEDDGIKDVTLRGPYLFKEIRLVEFPAQWSIPRIMRDEVLSPIVYEQDLNEIELLLKQAGELEVERDELNLKIYGYK